MAFLVEWSDAFLATDVDMPEGPWEPVTFPTIERSSTEAAPACGTKEQDHGVFQVSR